jgi:hypothetical protein
MNGLAGRGMEWGVLRVELHYLGRVGDWPIRYWSSSAGVGDVEYQRGLRPRPRGTGRKRTGEVKCIYLHSR